MFAAALEAPPSANGDELLMELAQVCVGVDCAVDSTIKQGALGVAETDIRPTMKPVMLHKMRRLLVLFLKFVIPGCDNRFFSVGNCC